MPVVAEMESTLAVSEVVCSALEPVFTGLVDRKVCLPVLKI